MFLVSNIKNKRSNFCNFWIINPFNTRQKSTSSKLILYGDEASPPVRFVMMTASLLNINYTFQKIDLFKCENKTDFYTQINPLQKVPALLINGEVLCDSHVIALHLCRSNENQDLYPLDPIAKARVDRLLFFNATYLFPVDSFIFTDYFAGKKSLNEEKIKEWYSSLKYLDGLLIKQQWLAGDQMRLCDICCGATISSLELLVPGIEKYCALKSWMERLQKLPCFEINKNGLKRLNSFVKFYESS